MSGTRYVISASAQLKAKRVDKPEKKQCRGAGSSFSNGRSEQFRHVSKRRFYYELNVGEYVCYEKNPPVFFLPPQTPQGLSHLDAHQRRLCTQTPRTRHIEMLMRMPCSCEIVSSHAAIYTVGGVRLISRRGRDRQPIEGGAAQRSLEPQTQATTQNDSVGARSHL